MFGWLKSDPKKKLERRYDKLLEEAMQLQRAGKIPEYAMKVDEAEAVRAEIDALKAAPTP